MFASTMFFPAMSRVSSVALALLQKFLMVSGVVFLIGLADGMFPGRRAIEAGDVEEERRLFYVAVTRARNELYLCYPKVMTKGGPPSLLSPSRFLAEVSSDLYQPLQLNRQWGW